MTTALGPPRGGNLERRANEAERRLLLTLDLLADRRRQLRANIRVAREKLQSGAAFFSMLFMVSVAMVGLFSLTRRRRPRWRR